ncbi:MAG: hypothetical protein KGL39_33120 [Patescibacteria group bacterium]|nr:hypothetical protein [Patescibacteria group bacterium]
MITTFSSPVTAAEVQAAIAKSVAPSARLVGVCGDVRFEITGIGGPNDHGEMFVTLTEEKIEP